MLREAEPRADLRTLVSRNVEFEEDGHGLSWREIGSRTAGDGGGS